MKPMVKTSLPLAAALLVAGCSSGGSSSFISFFEQQPRGSERNFAAISRSVPVNGFDSNAVVIGNTDVEDNSANVDIDVNLIENMTGFRLNGTATDIDFDDEDSDSELQDRGAFYTARISEGNRTAIGRIGDPETLNLAYHTYGAWVDIDGAGMGDLVAVATGILSTPMDVPTTGTATYLGRSVGVYLSEGPGEFVLTRSDVSAEMDFAGSSIDFATTNTVFGDTSRPEFNTSGTLAIAGAGASGNITTSGGLNGNADGVFAGPDALEFGGTLYAGDADEAYLAGFGTRIQQ